MTGVASMRHERVAALTLLAIGLLTSAWMQYEAVCVTGAARAREQQLEHLQTLTQPLVRLALDDRSPAAFRGLFLDQEVVWLRSPTGPVLSVARCGEGQAL